MRHNDIPLFFGKTSDRAFFDPSDWVKYVNKLGRLKKWRPVDSCIMTFNYDWFQLIKNNLELVDKFTRGIHVFKIGRKKIAAQHVSVGAAKAGINLEILIALGIKNFITIGSAGSLQPHVHPGRLCIPEKAIRDEGTSYHYQKPSKYAYPCRSLLMKLKKHLKSQKIDFEHGPTWTTDAPYRETLRKIRTYRKEGCLTVEMEAASLFSIAKFRKASLVSMLSVSDELSGTHWKPHFHHSKFRDTREKLLKIAIDTLLI